MIRHLDDPWNLPDQVADHRFVARVADGAGQNGHTVEDLDLHGVVVGRPKRVGEQIRDVATNVDVRLVEERKKIMSRQHARRGGRPR